MNQPIFGAAAERRDCGAGEPLPEIDGKSPAQVGAPGLDPADSPALQYMLKPSNGGFDFG